MIPPHATPRDRRPARPLDATALGIEPAEPGHVYLLGGGPGDPGLLTVRAAALLQTADLVAYDRLSPAEVLALVPADAERICVGKTVDRPGWSQEEIGRLLVNEARLGKAVVRLKGGDPFVFGRGGEEALACREAGVPVTVVSGVTSAVAAPAAAGIPVTHRAVATGVAFITGHEDPTKPESQVDWEALARFPGTLVFLMGVGNVGRIAGMLMSKGRAPTTPAALVRWGTTDHQEVLSGELVSIADDVRRAGFRSPAAIVVGDVVALRERIGDVGALAGIGGAAVPEPDAALEPDADPVLHAAATAPPRPAHDLAKDPA